MLLDALEELNNFERDCTEQRKWLVEKRSSQSEHLSEIEDQQRVIAQLAKQREKIEKRLDKALLTDKALDGVADVDKYSEGRCKVIWSSRMIFARVLRGLCNCAVFST